MPESKLDAFLVTGGRFHDMDFARLELLKLLAEHHHIRTKTGDGYGDIDAISQADFIVSYTCDLQPTPAQTRALRDYVAGGGKWFALHGTNSILRLVENGCSCPDNEAPEFFELLGTQFKAHPPIGSYCVEVTEPDHPLVRGIERFETVDELYLSAPRAPVQTLLHAYFKGEAPGFIDDEHWTSDAPQPVLYLRKFGKGEILYLTLGHCRGHYDLLPIIDFNPIIERCSWNQPIYYELLRRGINWGQGK